MLEKIIKARKIVMAIYLIILIAMLFIGLTYESLQPALTKMFRWYGWLLVFIVMILGILEIICRKNN